MKANHKKNLRKKEADETKLAWKKLSWLILGFFAIAFVITLLLAGFLRLPLAKSELATLRDYEAIRFALAHDQLAVAKTAAQVLINEPLAKRGIREFAKAVSQSQSLDAARTKFVKLSKEVADLAAHREGYYVMHCDIEGCKESCENCPMERFGRWVQTSEVVENPFMGLQHSKCGGVDHRF